MTKYDYWMIVFAIFIVLSFLGIIANLIFVLITGMWDYLGFVLLGIYAVSWYGEYLVLEQWEREL